VRSILDDESQFNPPLHLTEQKIRIENIQGKTKNKNLLYPEETGQYTPIKPSANRQTTPYAAGYLSFESALRIRL